MPTDLSIRAADGVSLAASLYRPEQPARGAVLIVPAMGVPQRFYARFAEWLVSGGFAVLTFDYRGMGRSRQGSLAAVQANIVTWAQQDTAAALEALKAQVPSVPLTWIGHSLGGQIVPFTPNNSKVAKIITVATGSGYWRQNAAPLKRKVWIFWYGAVPLATPLLGYFPGRRLGMVGDLPKGVVWQWRKWCMHPEYAAGAEGPSVRELYASVRTPMTSFSFTDDDMMSEQNVASIHGHYAQAKKNMVRLSPGQLGVKAVGHFGFFRDEMRGPLWQTHVAPELAH